MRSGNCIADENQRKEFIVQMPYRQYRVYRQNHQELADCDLPLPVQKEDWMAVWYVYGDESGKMGKDVDRTSFCGYVAHNSVWQIFCQNWNNARHKWNVPPIHMARIMNPDRKDDDWKKVKDREGNGWEKFRDLMLDDLAGLAYHTDLAAIGAAVDCAHFMKIADADPDFKKFHKNPVFAAFHTFVMDAIERTEVTDKSSTISIVIDNDREYAMKVYEQLEGLKDLALHDERFKKVRDRVQGISFVNDNHYPGVQLADMIAYESRKAMVERISNPDYISKLYDTLTFNRVNQPRYYTPEALDKLQANLKEGIANGSIKL